MRVGKLFWAAAILLRALLLWSGLTKLVDAHIPGHEEWNDVLSASKNQYNGQCCGLGDAHLMEFDDWRRTIDGNYGVYLLGQWRRIEPWKITINQVNATGKAIVWYDADPGDDDDATVRVIIYCFKPPRYVLDSFIQGTCCIRAVDLRGGTSHSAGTDSFRTCSELLQPSAISTLAKPI
jgi:hypothetical protein